MLRVVNVTVACSEVPGAAAEGDPRLCSDERGTGNDLHVIPQQPSTAAVGLGSLPLSQATQQLGR